jgi:hypothetical protein
MFKSGTWSVFRFVLFRSHRLTLSMPVSLSFTVVDFDFVLLMKHVQKAVFESLVRCLRALRRIDWCDVFYCCACFDVVCCRVLCCLVSGTGTGTRETGRHETGTDRVEGGRGQGRLERPTRIPKVPRNAFIVQNGNGEYAPQGYAYIQGKIPVLTPCILVDMRGLQT